MNNSVDSVAGFIIGTIEDGNYPDRSYNHSSVPHRRYYPLFTISGVEFDPHS